MAPTLLAARAREMRDLPTQNHERSSRSRSTRPERVIRAAMRKISYLKAAISYLARLSSTAKRMSFDQQIYGFDRNGGTEWLGIRT